MARKSGELTIPDYGDIASYVDDFRIATENMLENHGNWVSDSVGLVTSSYAYVKYKDSLGRAIPKEDNPIDLAKSIQMAANKIVEMSDKPYVSKGIASKSLYYAKLAEASYSGVAPDGFKILNSINFSNSGTQGFAYFDEKTKKITISFKGTDSGMVNDSKANEAIYNNGSSGNKQFEDALFFYKMIKKKYPQYDIQLTGHSLGGALAEYVGGVTGVKTYAFNPAGVPTGLDGRKFSNNITIVRSTLDTPSAVSTLNGASHLTGNIYNVVTNADKSGDIIASHSISEIVSGLTKTIKNTKSQNLIDKNIAKNSIIDGIGKIANSFEPSDADADEIITGIRN